MLRSRWSMCSVGSDAFTCSHTSDTWLVQNMFTTQHGYRASGVFLWSCHGDCKLTCLSNNEAVFSAILLITLRAFFIDWNSSERVLYAFPPPSHSLFVLSRWKLQSFRWKHIIISGWAVSVFTMPAPLCVIHRNRLHCQDVTKQISLEREGKRCFSNTEGQWLPRAISPIPSTFKSQRSWIELRSHFSLTDSAHVY